MEFVAKKKKLKVTIDEQSWEIGCPSIGQQEELSEKIKQAAPENVLSIYVEFFGNLGLPVEALKSLDSDEFYDLTKFVFSPKKN